MKKIFALLLSALTVLSVWCLLALRPLGTSDKAEALVIEQGMSVRVIAGLLQHRGLIRSARAFELYARLIGARPQAGAFSLSPSLSASEILEILASGKSTEFLITIPEGFTVAEIDHLLALRGLGKEGDFLDCAFRCDFSSFGFLASSAAGTLEQGIGSRIEGYLFPETYAVSPANYVPKFFIERMLGTFRKRIVAGYEKEISRSGKSLHELVTMASLVEEESRHADERAVIAGILWKRLGSRTVLGVDATTRYEVGKMTEPLTKVELETPSPYNTRRSQGLPPSPIANPGEEAFLAALKPKSSPHWYYLHGSDGLIHYAVTNDEHNANKAKYIR